MDWFRYWPGLPGALLLLMALGACAPVLSKNIREIADPLGDFSLLQAYPEQWQGRVVLLGGSLLAVHEDPAGSLLEILEWPLDYRLKPRPGDRSGGRFLIRLKGKADPNVWTQGRLITLAGRMVGVEARPLGQTNYKYPVFSLEEIHLWPVHATGWDSQPRVFIGLGGSVSF